MLGWGGVGGREAQSAEGSGPAGQHRELHVTQLSMTTRESERERERQERKSERERQRERTWKSSAAVRERSVGAECEEQSTQ